MNKDVNKYQKALKYARRGFAFYEKWTIEYFDLLQELVDKATPMKVKVDLGSGMNQKKYYYVYNEQIFLVDRWMRYCPITGQALDWSEDNER